MVADETEAERDLLPHALDLFLVVVDLGSQS